MEPSLAENILDVLKKLDSTIQEQNIRLRAVENSVRAIEDRSSFLSLSNRSEAKQHVESQYIRPNREAPRAVKYEGEIWDPEGNSHHAELLREALMRVHHCTTNTKARFKLFDSDPILKLVRRSSYQGYPHKAEHIPEGTDRKRGLPCVLCCTRCESSAGAHEGTRKARDTCKSWCKSCGYIPLCNIPRKQWGGISCFELWHSPEIDTELHGFGNGLACCRNRLSVFGDPFRRRAKVQNDAKHIIGSELEHIPGSPEQAARKRRKARSRATLNAGDEGGRENKNGFKLSRDMNESKFSTKQMVSPMMLDASFPSTKRSSVLQLDHGDILEPSEATIDGHTSLNVLGIDGA